MSINSLSLMCHKCGARGKYIGSTSNGIVVLARKDGWGNILNPAVTVCKNCNPVPFGYIRIPEWDREYQEKKGKYK